MQNVWNVDNLNIYRIISTVYVCVCDVLLPTSNHFVEIHFLFVSLFQRAIENNTEHTQFQNVHYYIWHNITTSTFCETRITNITHIYIFIYFNTAAHTHTYTFKSCMCFIHKRFANVIRTLKHVYSEYEDIM